MADNDRDRRPLPPTQTTSRLHSRVYTILVGLAAWLVMSVWIFSGGGATDYLLAIVSAFIFAAVMLQFILSRQRRTEDTDKQLSFRTWRSWDFETWTGRLSGAQASAEILLPIAAVAFGMTAFGIVLHLVELSS